MRTTVCWRRLVERGTRFGQLWHRDWDHHGGLPDGIRTQAKRTVLKHRGMLDETRVTWGGEFGRTAYGQWDISKTSFGRDHPPRCYSRSRPTGFRPAISVCQIFPARW